MIDDSESVLDALKTVLESRQWETLTYTNGETFIADLEYHRPDCVVLDSHLPGMSGAEVAQSITSAANPIPFVVLTAYPNSPQTNEIKNMGIGMVLLKPISEKVLFEHIQAAVTAV